MNLILTFVSLSVGLREREREKVSEQTKKKSLPDPTNEKKEHCIYNMKKEGKNVIYHIFDTTHHDAGRKGKRKEKM